MRQLKTIGGIVFAPMFFGVLLFVPAGTIHWWRAWVFLAAAVVCAAVSMSVIGKNEELLNERYKSPYQKGQPLADKIIMSVFVPAFAALIAFVPFDVFRLHLLPPPGRIVSLLGLVMFIGGWAIVALALNENTYAAPVIKHQEERHQHAIDTGVYAIVRHPMYAGGLLLLPGMSLWLESYAGALLSIIPCTPMALRILVEERFLLRELPDYEAYRRKVPYRLIPFVW